MVPLNQCLKGLVAFRLVGGTSKAKLEEVGGF